MWWWCRGCCISAAVCWPVPCHRVEEYFCTFNSLFMYYYYLLLFVTVYSIMPLLSSTIDGHGFLSTSRPDWHIRDNLLYWLILDVDNPNRLRYIDNTTERRLLYSKPYINNPPTTAKTQSFCSIVAHYWVQWRCERLYFNCSYSTLTTVRRKCRTYNIQQPTNSDKYINDKNCTLSIHRWQKTIPTPYPTPVHFIPLVVCSQMSKLLRSLNKLPNYWTAKIFAKIAQ